MNRRNTSQHIEALKQSGPGRHAERVRKARRLIHDIESLHNKPADAPEQLRQDVAELVGTADYESAKYELGERTEPITECSCPNCSD